MYIYGKRNEKSYIRLLNYLLKYDVISFDIFDTTIVRICDSPIDVFKIMEKKTKLLGIDDFKNIRLKAQKLAETKTGVSTNLNDIYKYVKELSGLNDERIKKLQDLEIQTEAKMCIPNATTVSLINDLNERGKKVILTSDMYLDSVMIKDIFRMNRMKIIYDHLFVSCEIGKSKAKGNLYDYIRKRYTGNSIIHVGDYWRSDVYNALRIGNINAVYYPLNGKGKGEYELFVRNSISDKENYIYRWAYKEFAPVLWNFCKWIGDEAKKKEISELLFLTREGAFFKQLFEIYNSNEKIHSHIFFASRRSLLCASSDINWSWMPQTFGNVSVDFLLDAFHIDKKKYNEKTLSEKVENWKNIKEIKDDMEKYSIWQRKLLIQYIDAMIGKNKKIGLVDVGWKGSSQYFLEKIFVKEERDTCVSGFYLGEFYDKRHENLDKEGFLCSSEDIRYKEAILNAGFIFENILSPALGTTIGYEVKEEKIVPILDSINLLDNELIKEAQKAISDYFCNYKLKRDIVACPQKENSISILFKHLNNPTYTMAKEIGDIQWIDFDVFRYAARPEGLFTYIFRPKKFLNDLKYCGWNSAFLLRCFKIPIPYFKIYKFLRRQIKNENKN